MSILITGMEMPTNTYLALNIYPDGRVATNLDANCATAISVPTPHGDLIEKSKVLDIVFEWCPDDDGSVGKDGDLREMLDENEALPTIIPAEEGEKE